MCTVSNIMDGWRDTYPSRYPTIPWSPVHPIPGISAVSRAEFEALRKEVLELKELLTAAKKFDDATGQPECENEAKLQLLRDVAKAVGVDINDIFQEK